MTKPKLTIKLHPIKLVQVRLGIRGIGGMIQHRISEETLGSLEPPKPGEPKRKPKGVRNPAKETEDAKYRTFEGKPGILAMGLKKSLIEIAHKDTGVPRAQLMKAMYIVCNDPKGVIPFTNDPSYRGRTDPVSTGGGKPGGKKTLTYRPEYTGWKATVDIRIDYDVVNEADICNLINRAGFGAGMGDWRPSLGGEHGRYELDPDVPLAISEVIPGAA